MFLNSSPFRSNQLTKGNSFPGGDISSPLIECRPSVLAILLSVSHSNCHHARQLHFSHRIVFSWATSRCLKLVQCYEGEGWSHWGGSHGPFVCTHWVCLCLVSVMLTVAIFPPAPLISCISDPNEASVAPKLHALTCL